MGAGAAGVPAAISAKEAGATVALIQKEATAISQGNTATGILLDGSDPAGVSAVVTAFKKTVERYNALAAEGKDEDFGKASKWLTTIDTPPFYDIHLGPQFLRPVEAFSRISRANVRGGDAWIHTYPGRPGAVLLRSRRRATP